MFLLIVMPICRLFRVLVSLTRVGKNIIIEDNDRLTSVSGFDKLATIIGNLNIGRPGSSGFPAAGNPLLTSLPTFPKLTRIDGSLNVIENDALETLSGFAALDRIGGNLFIVDNAVLATVSGFDVLATITGDLDIGFPGSEGVVAVGNPLLTSLPTFPKLTRIDGSLNVVDNDALDDLFRFCRYSIPLGASLLIRNNTSLTTFSGFGGISIVSGDPLFIQSNAKLTSIPTFDASLHASMEDPTILSRNALLPSISSFSALKTIGAHLYYL